MDLDDASCQGYFFGTGTGTSRCEGYLGFLQVASLVAIIAQGLLVFFSYRMWKITDSKQTSQYESINDAKIKSSFANSPSFSASSKPQSQKSSLVIREDTSENPTLI